MDKSLDEIVKEQRSERKSSGNRPQRGNSKNTGRQRAAPYRNPRQNNNNNNNNRGGFRQQGDFAQGGFPQGQWQHDMFGSAAQVPVMAAVGGLSTGGKLLISNLDSGVNDDDMKELFGKFGSLKKAFVHYDRSGRSLGTAEVVYSSHDAAAMAMREYNNVALDGKPMRIELVSNGAVAMAPAPVMQPRNFQPRQQFNNNNNNNNNRNSRNNQPRQQRQGGGSGSGRGGRGGNRSNTKPKEQKASKTAEDLDKELEAYSAANVEK